MQTELWLTEITTSQVYALYRLVQTFKTPAMHSSQTTNKLETYDWIGNVFQAFQLSYLATLLDTWRKYWISFHPGICSQNIGYENPFSNLIPACMSEDWLTPFFVMASPTQVKAEHMSFHATSLPLYRNLVILDTFLFFHRSILLLLLFPVSSLRAAILVFYINFHNEFHCLDVLQGLVFFQRTVEDYFTFYCNLLSGLQICLQSLGCHHILLR